MVCSSSTREGRELLALRAGLEAYVEAGKTFGIPFLHPWANRVSRDRFALGGREVDATGARRDPDGAPIHGLLTASPGWRVEAAGESAIVARHAWDGEHLEAFPFPHDVELAVTLAPEGLTITTTVTATAEVEVPVSFGFHPYLALPPGDRAGARVALPVRRRQLVDDRGLPTGAHEDVGAVPRRPLGEATYDDCFDRLGTRPSVRGRRRARAALGRARPRLRGGAGLRPARQRTSSASSRWSPRSTRSSPARVSRGRVPACRTSRSGASAWPRADGRAGLLRLARGVAELARGAPRRGDRGVGRLLEEAHGEAVARVVRRGRPGALRRLDRRAGPADRRRAPRPALHPAQARLELVEGQRREGRAADRRGPDAAGGDRGLEARREDRTGVYTYESEVDPAEVARVEVALRADAEAWAFLASQAPSYRRTAIRRILSAKREATREKRLAELLADSRAGAEDQGALVLIRQAPAGIRQSC